MVVRSPARGESRKGHNKPRPPLTPGDWLTRAEFERRYRAHPEIKKAELVEGVVYMPSPTHYRQHGLPHFIVNTWLGMYVAHTPGVFGGDNATVRLDFENEVQPDALLRLAEQVGGRSHVTEDDYLAGPPELVVEIAASSVAYDMHVKRRVYARNGVQEYIALQIYEQRLDWFVLREGVYEALAGDGEGVIYSQAFPGLWLHVQALLAGNSKEVLDVLQVGLKSEEHGVFVERLRELAATSSSTDWPH